LKKLLLILALTATPLMAQNLDELSFEQSYLLRNASGTSADPGPMPHHGRMFTSGSWSGYFDGSAFATYVSESGPSDQRNEVFSTNWGSAAVQRNLGSRGLLLLRGRVSLEPLTVKEAGYPQMLQYVSTQSGGPALDSMRAHDLIGEAAADLAFRVAGSSFINLYVAPVGDPALGAVPFAQRASSREFAEAPFTYDVAELTHDSTSVVTLGWGSRYASVEGSVFHDAVTTGRHTTLDNGDIDSRSVRLTLTPTRNTSFQVSRGELGDAELEMTTVSASYGSEHAAATVLWTRREVAADADFDAFSFDARYFTMRNTFMVRIENVDRPQNLFAAVPGGPATAIVPEATTHFTVGYIFDFKAAGTYRAGAGVNFDYHTQTHELDQSRYGHKPQAIYVFARVRMN
jgi:hypothetical protein